MASPHIGSDELVFIQTEDVCLTLKGPARHPRFQQAEYTAESSRLKLHCTAAFKLALRGEEPVGVHTVSGGVHTGVFSVAPLFYEQQRYELVIEAAVGHTVAFWHDNLQVRNKVSPVGRRQELLSGVLNFGNNIGFSDLVVILDGSNYLRLTIEVFPTKISYKEDYLSIVEDVTKEVYNIVFDFLKKTYLSYQQSAAVHSSPVEFFAVLRQIFADFIKAADMVLAQPHHVLETVHTVLPGHKIKKADTRTARWLEKHPAHISRSGGLVAVDKALAVQKRVTYNTKENQLTKYILQSTVDKLISFAGHYRRLQRESDGAVVAELDRMINNLQRRCRTSFLAEVSALPASSGMSLVFSMAPGYRELYKYYLLLSRGLALSGDVFNISVKDLAVLYEYWCFIKLNSLMKERYELVSQDIIKVQGNGLFVSLVKGQGSRVKYRNPANGDVITLAYNPQLSAAPTVSQRPDNVLSLTKRSLAAGETCLYEYVFDAKYRLNPALPGSDYYAAVSYLPGPEVGDINTMHRYRDAIVYEKAAGGNWGKGAAYRSAGAAAGGKKYGANAGMIDGANASLINGANDANSSVRSANYRSTGAGAKAGKVSGAYSGMNGGIIADKISGANSGENISANSSLIDGANAANNGAGSAAAGQQKSAFRGAGFNGGSLYERTMFGAYVLFPYDRLEEYREHRFFKSIEQVNIGGLPFLPSATQMVADLLDELIADSPDSAFERATLPRGIEERLARTDWSVRDVLVGTLRNKEQMAICLQHKFYYLPAARLAEKHLPVHYVALYQSKNLFNSNSGIYYYGAVTRCQLVRRSAISEVPRESDELYYRLDVQEWKQLARPIRPREVGFSACLLTNLFLLQHSAEVPELNIRSEAEYRLFSELKRLTGDASVNDEDNNLGFRFNDDLITFEDGSIVLYKDGKIRGRYAVADFAGKPGAVFRRISSDIGLRGDEAK